MNPQENQNETLNTYHAFWKGKQIELKAPTSRAAQIAAANQLKARKVWDVTIVLVAKSNGEEVVHRADF